MPTLVMHVHLTDRTLLDHANGAGAGGGTGVVRTDRLGPQAIETIHRWVGHVKVVVKPVLDAQAIGGTDRYEIPEAMREVITTRHPICVFPGCTTRSTRCDLDHIQPYRHHRSHDSTGPSVAGVPEADRVSAAAPPPQTRLGNLAPLCRRHHRYKTHYGWAYHPIPGGFIWTSPTGTQFHTSLDGTTRLE